ncbi:DUF1206 domain-containing protein [Sphingomicrobium aestuariivivum]|uniref:DUF1206 domain-containing protein n=1 Tax=Sphingomicrobium aestuariivivum TaxID=1582356 RepID=UPI001FD6D4BF|nr:DUF1206 domain-containing protein [Sphingomicrobium aestuariivivum]MCJ8191377.1 DUF1206 domain-containing protein [Sphingomicrobium aestuariivivum]
MVTTSSLESTASSLENWTRVGYVARGLIYILLGYVALSASAPDSSSELFKQVEELPAGTVLLWIIMIGAFGYGLWKIFDAVKNLEGFDDDAKGKAKRFFYIVGGVGYWILAFLAAKTVFGSGGSGDGTEEAAAMAPDWLLLATGAGILIAGVYQIKKGVTRDFLRGLAAGTPPFVGWLGLAGHLARGIVFIVSGWAVIQATGNADAAKGLPGALASLKDMGTVFTLLCIGLILFGIFSLIEARYRIIPNEDLRPGR